MTKYLSTTIASLAVAGLLAGCGGNADAQDAADAHDLGDAVTVPFYPYDAVGGEPTGQGTVAVTQVRAGSSDELVAAGYDLDADQQAATPYYVDVAYENTGDSPIEPRDPSARDADDNLVTSLTVIDFGGPAFDLCPGIPEKVAPGETAGGCAIFLVPDGVRLEQITYLPDVTEDTVFWRAEA